MCVRRELGLLSAESFRDCLETTAPFWTPMHPAWRRCSSLTYARYARSSRLAMRAPRRPEMTHLFPDRPLARSIGGVVPKDRTQAPAQSP